MSEVVELPNDLAEIVSVFGMVRTRIEVVSLENDLQLEAVLNGESSEKMPGSLLVLLEVQNTLLKGIADQIKKENMDTDETMKFINRILEQARQYSSKLNESDTD